MVTLSEKNRSYILTNLFRKTDLARAVHHIFQEAAEKERDIAASFRSGAMPSGKRLLDVTKIFIGVTTAAVTEGVLGPLSGLSTAADAVYDMEESGHQYRLTHPMPQ